MSRRILLVEEDDFVCRQLSQAFAREGFEVLRERDGDAAIAILAREKLDGLVLELMLRGASASRVAAAAREQAPPEDLPILAITDVYGGRHCRADAVQRYGLLDLLIKPVNPGEALQAFMRHRRDRALAPKEHQPDLPQPGSSEPAGPSDGPEEPAKVPVRTMPRLTAAARPDVRTLTPLALTPIPIQRTDQSQRVQSEPPSMVQDPQAFFSQEFIPVVTDLPPQLIRGDFELLPFPALLHSLSFHRASGTLYLRQERKKKVIYLVQGVPRQVKSNLLQECLGRILVRESMISENELRASVAEMKARQKLQGQVLVEMGSISEKNLRNGLERQIERKILEVFIWPYGAYRFNPAASPPPSDLCIPTQICELVREGMLRFYPQQKVREEVDALRDHRPIWGSEAAMREQPMGLTPDEEAFFALFNGFRSVQELIQDSGLPRDHSERLLLGLLHVRKAELEPPPPGGEGLK